MADLELDNIQGEEKERPAGRREFITRLGSAGLGVAAGALIAGCGGGGSGFGNTPAQAQVNANDQALLNAAATAEALATTMYYNIITSPIYSTSLNGNAPDQAYLVAAYQQEIDHYNLLTSVGAVPLTTTFYFPTGMFTTGTGLQTTLDTLTTLESAFIAAYLYGINAFSAVGNKVLAGQILGVESEHRALARIIAHDVGLTFTKDLAGAQENVMPDTTSTSNNIAYERTYGITSVAQITTALAGFVGTTGQPGNGFSATPYTYASATTNSQPKTLMTNTNQPISAVTLNSNTPTT